MAQPIRHVILAALVETVARESRRALVLFFAFSLVTALWFSRAFPPQEVFAWLAYMTAACLFTFMALGIILNDPAREEKARRSAAWLVICALLIGGGWGAFTFLFFPLGNESLIVFLILATASLIAVGHSYLSPVPSVCWSFLAASALPLCAFLATRDNGEHFEAGAFLAVFVLAMAMSAKGNEKKARMHLREKVILRKEVEGRRLLEKMVLSERARAETAIAARTGFMSGVSLELRTYLNSIIGFSRILMKNREGNLSDRDVSRSEKINRNGRQLLLVIDNVLNYSKLESNQLEADDKIVDLRNLIEDSAELQCDVVQERGLKLTWHVDENVPAEIITDPTHLWQILNNLIANAVKFTPKGTIEVRVDHAGSKEGNVYLKFSVKDSGIGIDENTRDSLFSPFAQGENAQREVRSGIGLGLAIAQSLVRLLGGEITVWSRPNEGAVFSFTIACKMVEEPAVVAGEGSES